MEWIWTHGHVIAFGGAVVAAFGAWATTKEQARQQVRYEQQVADLNAALAARTAELAAKSDEVARLAQQGLNATTGGDSFAYLQPLRRRGRVTYFVRQAGAHPTFDVVIRVQDGTGQHLLFGPTMIGTIKRGSGMDWTSPLPPWPLAPDRRLRDAGWPDIYVMPWPLTFQEPAPAGSTSSEFRIEIAARNGIIVQKLRVWPQGDRWYTASRDLTGRAAAPTLPEDFDEAQDQDADGNRLSRPAGGAYPGRE
jgi:hypothetical protein